MEIRSWRPCSKLVDDAELREDFIQRSKERVKDSSWDRLVDTTLGVFDQVVRGRTG